MPPYLSLAGGDLVDEGGTEAFLRRVLNAVELPVFLYSMPGERDRERRRWGGGGGQIAGALRQA